jgi:hypothetical protein
MCPPGETTAGQSRAAATRLPHPKPDLTAPPTAGQSSTARPPSLVSAGSDPQHDGRKAPRVLTRTTADGNHRRLTQSAAHSEVGSGESAAGYFSTNFFTMAPLALPQSWMWLDEAPQCEMPMCLPVGNAP